MNASNEVKEKNQDADGKKPMTAPTRDWAVKTLKPLPQSMSTCAMIQNPCNMNEIFVFSVGGKHNIYIYNQTTNTFIKNEHDNLTSILPKPHLFEIKTCYAFKTTSPNSIAVLGVQIDRYNKVTNYYDNHFSFYSIFNSKTLKFEKVGTKKVDNNSNHDDDNNHNIKNVYVHEIGNQKLKHVNPKAIYNKNIGFEHIYSQIFENGNQRIDIDTLLSFQYLPFWSHGSRLNVYKNYLIVTQDDFIQIYDIKDEYNPTLLMYVVLGEQCFKLHGSVIVSNNIDINININNNDVIKFVTFGGDHKDFLQSFQEYEINFEQLEKTIQSQSQSQSKKIEQEKFGKNKNENINYNIVHNVGDYHLNNLSNIITKTKNDELSKKLNIEGLVAEAKRKNFDVTFPNDDDDVRYGIFGCNLYNSRCLMIYDLLLMRNIAGKSVGVNVMIVFDFETKEWKIHNNFWPYSSSFNNPIWNKGHAFIQSKYDGILLQTMGGIYSNVNLSSKAHFMIKLSKSIDWSIERLLWIGYLKNDKQSQPQAQLSMCPLSTVPKDMILLILKFLNGGFVFAT